MLYLTLNTAQKEINTKKKEKEEENNVLLYLRTK